MVNRLPVPLIAALYLLAVIVAVVAYPRHVLTYGFASWSGGVLFVLGVEGYRHSRRG